MNVPNTPSTLPFRHWGMIPSVCVLSGLPIFILGATGEVSFSNKKLMLGWLLLSFGAFWHYGRRACIQRTFLEVAKFAFFLAVTAVAGYCLIYGRLPHRIGILSLSWLLN